MQSADKFTLQDLQRLAKLAKLEINAAQSSDTVNYFQDIFGKIAEILQVNTDDTIAMIHPRDANQPLRADIVTEGNIEQRDRCLDIAPESETGFYLLPRVIE